MIVHTKIKYSLYQVESNVEMLFPLKTKDERVLVIQQEKNI